MALLSESTALRTVRSNIPYWELYDYGERFVPEGTESARRLACYWSQRKPFLLDVLGNAFIEGTAGTAGAKLRRYIPEKHPGFNEVTDFYGMWAVDAVLVQGAGWANREYSGAIKFNDSPPTGTSTLRAENGEGLAIYDVRYQPTIHYVLDDDQAAASGIGELSRFTVFTAEPGGENLPLPKNYLRWESSGADARDGPELAPILFPSEIINLQWLMVPVDAFRDNTILGYSSAPGTFVQGAVGAVNDDDFLGYEEGTLLCLPPTRRLYIGANTNIFLDITFHFQYRPMGHNYFLRNSGEWEKLVRGDDPTNGPFLEFDFTKILDVASP